PPASTVLRIPLRGTRLRRAVDPGDLCQPSGPDGEGQARGQARNARGEPPVGKGCSLPCQVSTATRLTCLEPDRDARRGVREEPWWRLVEHLIGHAAGTALWWGPW